MMMEEEKVSGHISVTCSLNSSRICELLSEGYHVLKQSEK